MKPVLILVSTLALLPITGPSSRADLLLQLTHDSQIANGATPILFSGTLTNNGSTSLFLNGSDYSSLGNALEIDDSSFLLNAPASLAPNATWTGSLFTAKLNADVPLDVYEGTFNVIGGTSTDDRLTLASAGFRVTTVPAPGSLVTALIGIVPGVLLLRRRRK